MLWGFNATYTITIDNMAFAVIPEYTEFLAFGYPILATVPHPLSFLHTIIPQLLEKENVNLIF